MKSVHIRSFSGPHFPAFGLNREKYFYLFIFGPNAGEYRPEKFRIRIACNSENFGLPCIKFPEFFLCDVPWASFYIYIIYYWKSFLLCVSNFVLIIFFQFGRKKINNHHKKLVRNFLDGNFDSQFSTYDSQFTNCEALFYTLLSRISKDAFKYWRVITPSNDMELFTLSQNSFNNGSQMTLEIRLWKSNRVNRTCRF